MLHIAFAGAIVLAAPASKSKEGSANDIYAEWIIESVQANGAVQPKKKDDICLRFEKGGKCFMRTGVGEESLHSTFSIDTSKKPFEIEIDFDPERRLNGKKMLGIFKIDGNELTMCLIESEKGDRPTSFDALKGSKRICYTLKKNMTK